METTPAQRCAKMMRHLVPRPFPPYKEKLYQTRQNERALPAARLALMLAPVVCLAFGFWDYRLDPTALSQTLPLRTIFSFFCIAIWAGTFFEPFCNHLSSVLSFTAVIASISLVSILRLLPDGMLYGLAGFTYPQIVLMIIPDTRYTLFNGLILLVLINFYSMLYHIPSDVLFNCNSMLACLSVLTFILAYTNETRARQLFELEVKLGNEAATDELSGALNRRYFTKVTRLEIERSRRYDHSLTLLILDVDHFKKVNDTYGHFIGDETIQAVADICKNCLRTVDILGRIGGEEFAVLLPETDTRAGLLAAERLRLALSRAQLRTSDPEILTHSITVSIGLATCASEDTIDTIMKRADTALYQAKARGRNRVEACELPNICVPVPISELSEGMSLRIESDELEDDTISEDVVMINLLAV
jgi:diguanylate cyclase (GGDEF)-like protein